MLCPASTAALLTGCCLLPAVVCTVVAVDLVAQQAAGQAGAVAPDVAKAVYALAAASGSVTAYDALVSMYEQVRTASGGLSGGWSFVTN